MSSLEKEPAVYIAHHISGWLTARYNTKAEACTGAFPPPPPNLQCEEVVYNIHSFVLGQDSPRLRSDIPWFIKESFQSKPINTCVFKKKSPLSSVVAYSHVNAPLIAKVHSQPKLSDHT